MLIVIPTYKRNDCLKWVLQSLVQCRTESIPEQIRVVVVNNYPPAAQEITNIVDHFSKDERFSWEVLYREKTLLPVDNWYSAITEKAWLNEVVFLHGDDDLFCPCGLQDRYAAIVKSSADMLLSHAESRIIFDSISGTVLENISQSVRQGFSNSGKLIEIALDDIHCWGAAFIGNHVYRNTETWRRALATCFDWCNTQNWLDWNKRTLMLPYYLPIAVKRNGGKLFGLDTICVLRGGEREELNRSRFGVSGWNSGLLALAAYQILNSGDLQSEPLLESNRLENRKMAIQWLVTFFFDKSIKTDERNKMIRASNLKIKIEDLPDFVKGIRLIFGEIFRLRSLRMNRRFHVNAVPISKFLADLDDFFIKK